MDAAARKRKSREKLKSDPDKLRKFLEKEKERDKKRYKIKRNDMLKSKKKLEASRLANRIYQRKCREKKKLALLKEQVPISPLGSYRCKQTLSKAVKKSLKTLPSSPTKTHAVVLELVKRTLPHGVVNEKLITLAPKRSDALTEDTIELVKSFYESDDISRQTPNRKDVIRVKDADGGHKTIPKKHLIMTVDEVYSLFKLKYPNVIIKRTKFFELRPFHVRAMSEMPHNVCVCVYHGNFEYLVDALKDSLDEKITDSYQLLKAVCCDTDNEQCMTGKCQKCFDISDVVKLNEDLNVRTQWKQWGKSTDGWLQIQEIQGTRKELLKEIERQLPNYKTHCFTKKVQSRFFEKSRQESSNTDGVMQLDFAENFSIIAQDEIQSAHWRHPQVTLFTCCVWIQKAQKVANYVVVSDDLSHDKTSVWIFIKKIIEHTRIEFQDLVKLTVFTDGCAAQFKNRYTLSSVYYGMEDWGVKIDWAFFATSHGKGAVDGLGAVAKRKLWNAIKARQVSINTAWDCYEYLTANSKDVNYLYVSANDYNSSVNIKEMLQQRWDDLELLAGIQKHHFFSYCSGKCISYKLTANSTTKTTSLFKNKVNYHEVYSNSEEEDIEEQCKEVSEKEENLSKDECKQDSEEEETYNREEGRKDDNKEEGKAEDIEEQGKGNSECTMEDSEEEETDTSGEKRKDENKEGKAEDILEQGKGECTMECKEYSEEKETYYSVEKRRDENKEEGEAEDIDEQGKGSSEKASKEESEKENNSKEKCNEEEMQKAGCSGQFKNEYNRGDFVLVKFPGRKVEYRYAGIIDQIDYHEDEITITYLRICNDNGKLYKVAENDISDVGFEQIIKKLPTPTLVSKGNRIFYRFNQPVDVFEK